MAVTSEELTQENPTDRFPLLMEQAENRERNEHVIDVEQGSGPSSSGSSVNDFPHDLEMSNHENRHSSSSSDESNSQSPTSARRGEGSDRRWSPFNTLLWLSIELIFTLGQIVAAIVVLSLSREENPETPLFAWIVGYATGCAASLPLLYWRYLLRYQATNQRSAQLHQGSPQVNSTAEPNSYITISLTRSSNEEDGRTTPTDIWSRQSNARLGSLVDHFKMALDCFFAVWFVVGNVWIFGGHSSSSEAPNMYRLCIAFLTISCIGYAMPFILCAMICCCLPCIISILGVRENMHGVRGATEESINALPTLKYRAKTDGTGGNESKNPGGEEGGCVAAGTEKERAISGEDAVCCICLAKYEDNDELRELPCSHFFHTQCVDKWLKINASCPLCKSEIDAKNTDQPSVEEEPLQQS
ncbi:putative sulfate transporter 3.5-like [Capsicum annuum]|uniref:E3 ubiquitin-protein ligase At1g63170 n=1 Tax=Capsicum annuum TaxID=4072 RepID=UPI001FB17B5E|nr:E3 ubiquitin-protein ligase At1g63170 [Capsicum annuum]XP_047252478.1 E3 ubiquitin-protein ligase At1g63170 [Capsicum annuum]XP_047252479.1 E3 ubiquitin-protein ligase At1g63170 [Capsicum annuum]XP_047252480.1 E3 ubiquitin-protein ligase At1g63170 [Capsicum annuum]XP_047252481.1 E3 ubiquitin-protein ligase At1g63170 [Capsicum annuum]XP_047252482.1 E3 ubiquitin-protein ligase At1g63170 [Capsicum annuum]XP_047252483.1 E3 ubiquitin-protein ligase At1g63170 [Capsicum annuum]KAF3668418.1 putat